MKKIVSTLLVLLSFQSLAADLSIGSPAPEIEARLLDGDFSFKLSQARGKVVVVNFWASWCAPCRAEMPLLQTYYEQHKAEGLELLAINMDETKDLASARRIAQLYRFPVALKADSSFKGFGRIWRLPTTFVVDKDGILRKNGHVGDAEITQTELDSVVTPLLGK